MKILALLGSPRKRSNTDLMMEEALSGCRDRGLTTEKLCLYDFDISPCLDCRKCKKGDFTCAQGDGMQDIYPMLDAADAIIFGTPNYWYGPTAKMKLLIDRLRPYVGNRILKGKKAAVISPAAEGPGASRLLAEMFRLSFDYLEMDLIGTLLAAAYEKGEIRDDRETLERAYNLGASL